MNSSLRNVLLRWLLMPFGACILILLPITYQLLHQHAVEAYDQALADASLALVPHLDVADGKVSFDFPTAAEEVLRTDRYDEIYYLVLGKNHQFIAGDKDLPASDLGNLNQIKSESLLYDAVFRGRNIRVSAVQRIIGGISYIFIVAETTFKRDRIAADLRIALIAPVMILALATAMTILFAIRHALAPMELIRLTLKNMQDRDLRPLDEQQAPIEIRPLVHEFNALLGRLDAASEAQQRFVANAAHQLRTPLAGVRTQLELAAIEPEEVQRSKRISQSIAAVVRLGHLINQLLTLLSAAPGGRDGHHGAQVDIPDIIRERSTEWVRLATARNIDLGFELNSARINGDALMVGEMIANLVDNALRFTPFGGTVTVRCGMDFRLAFIEVEDNGPGIPSAERKRVFERFFRLPNATASGSGLGLSIVQEIAHGLDGKAIITSPASGVGTIVQIQIPCLVH
jgi:two-component system sensor histidine kinase TctE